MQIEAAYDTIFMGSMKRRLSGKSDVSTSVRYADVPATASRSKSVVVVSFQQSKCDCFDERYITAPAQNMPCSLAIVVSDALASATGW